MKKKPISFCVFVAFRRFTIIRFSILVFVVLFSDENEILNFFLQCSFGVLVSADLFGGQFHFSRRYKRGQSKQFEDQ